MNADKLKKQIEQTRIDEQNALVALGRALGARQAYEALLHEVNMQAAVEKQQAQEAQTEDTQA